MKNTSVIFDQKIRTLNEAHRKIVLRLKEKGFTVRATEEEEIFRFVGNSLRLDGEVRRTKFNGFELYSENNRIKIIIIKANTEDQMKPEETQLEEEQNRIDSEQEQAKVEVAQDNKRTEKIEDGNNIYFKKNDGTFFKYLFRRDTPMIIVGYDVEKKLMFFKSGLHRQTVAAPVSDMVHEFISLHWFDSSVVLYGSPEDEFKLVTKNPYKVIQSLDNKYFIQMVWEGDKGEKLGSKLYKNYLKFYAIEKPV